MTLRFHDLPIRRKLMAALLLTSGAVLLLTCTGFITYEIVTLRKGMVDGYSTRADIIAANSTAALAFQNVFDATDVLDGLKTDPKILAAGLYDDKGKLFARYPAGTPAGLFPAGPGVSGYGPGRLEIFRPVVRDGRALGTVYLRSDLSALTDRYRAYAWLTAAIFAGSLLAAFLLARLLQKQISRPILALAETARAVSQSGDFSVRAQKFGGDELGSLTDAFNRMLAEISAQDRALKEKTRLLDSVMQNMSEGIVVADQGGRMVYFNKGAERIIGIGMSEKASSEWTREYGVFKEDKATPFLEDELPLVKAVRGAASAGVIQFLRNSGHPEGIFIRVTGTPLRNAKGELDGGLVVVRDITRELRDEEALKVSEKNYREIFDKANDAIYIHDAETGRVLDVNQRTCDLFGFTREEFLDGDPNRFMTGNPGYTFEDAAQRLRKAATEGPQLFEWQGRNKDGSFRWLEVSLKKAVIAGQERLLALVRDIGERKKLEETLQTQNFISSVLENLPNMVFVKDAKDLRFVMFNRAGEELLGVPKADLIGKNDYDFFPKGDADFFTSKDRKVLESGKQLDIPEETLQTRDKGARTLHTKKIPISDKDGVPRYLLGISEDITEQKRQEQLRVYASALEVSNQELQDFVFVASHDLQEPLRKIQAFGGFLQEEFKESLGDTGKDYVERMRSAANRMQTLINDLLALTRVTTKAQPFTPTDLSQEIEGVLSDLETRIRETGARVEVGPLPTLEADATQMRQLFQNLIGNALKFHRPGVPPEIHIRGEILNGAGPGENRCLIRVEDNGIGFDNKYADQIFKVFERLHGRDEYEGTGIGLAICRKVVERHQGTIQAGGLPGKGSTFTITLPLQQKR